MVCVVMFPGQLQERTHVCRWGSEAAGWACIQTHAAVVPGC